MTTSHLPHDPVWMFHSVPEDRVQALAGLAPFPYRSLGCFGNEATRRRMPSGPFSIRRLTAIRSFLFARWSPPWSASCAHKPGRAHLSLRRLRRRRASEHGAARIGAQEFGARVEYYIPNRLHEGYGLSQGAVRSWRQPTCSSRLIAASRRSTRWPRPGTGRRRVITDHHEPQAEIPQPWR